MVQTTRNYKPVGHKDLVYFTFISEIRFKQIKFTKNETKFLLIKKRDHHHGIL